MIRSQSYLHWVLTPLMLGASGWKYIATPMKYTCKNISNLYLIKPPDLSFYRNYKGTCHVTLKEYNQQNLVWTTLAQPVYATNKSQSKKEVEGNSQIKRDLRCRWVNTWTLFGSWFKWTEKHIWEIIRVIWMLIELFYMKKSLLIFFRCDMVLWLEFLRGFIF